MLRDYVSRCQRAGLATPALLMALAMGLGACSSYASRVDNRAAELGFERQIVASDPFHLVTYRNSVQRDQSPLHVYIEGDGRAWLDRTTVARDPTPARPLMLELMAFDSAPAVFLGRPCYFGTYRDAPCDFRLWTTARYSEPVVSSMLAALESTAQGEREIVLVGYSGGGTLATLLASRSPRVTTVVTIAANLDLDGWAQHHGYSPLTESLNPATDTNVPASVKQIYLYGGNDDQVPVSTIGNFERRHPGATFCVVPQFDHSCCWRDIWGTVLERLSDGHLRRVATKFDGSFCSDLVAAASHNSESVTSHE